MAKKYYIETTTTGRKQWTLKRSHSHHHHHDHHGHHEYYRVTQDEWNAMVERERELSKTNQGLVNEVETLKVALQTSQGDVHRLTTHTVPRLQDQITTILAENQSLRRSIDSAGDRANKHHRETGRLDIKIDKLEAENRMIRDENDDLRVRIKALSKQLDHGLSRRVAEVMKEVDHWKDHFHRIKTRYDDLRYQHEKVLDVLETRTKKVDTYEDILKRRGIV